jgi:6-pyruvoyltetrahydropterin/6-carboxytetrahydropterin synthase
MFEVSVESHFDAAHFLRDYHGKCENLHGHRYNVILSIKSDKLDKGGMAYDFELLKKHLNAVLDDFDHHSLNDVPPFDKINPSAENIAVTIYERCKPLLGNKVAISKVQVWETPNNQITYYPE